MSLNLVDIGNEGAFMESWARAEDRAAAMRWAMDCDIYAGRSRLKPLVTLISTPQSVQSKFEQMYRDAARTGTGAMSIHWDPAAPGADRSVDAGFVAIVHSDLLADMEAMSKVQADTDAKPPMTLEEMRALCDEIQALTPEPSEFVELPLNPQMAEIVGVPAVEVRRDLYESLMRGPFTCSAEL